MNLDIYMLLNEFEEREVSNKIKIIFCVIFSGLEFRTVKAGRLISLFVD